MPTRDRQRLAATMTYAMAYTARCEVGLDRVRAMDSALAAMA